MQVQKLLNNTYIIRIEPKESLVANLEKFARDNQIGFAKIDIIGGGFQRVTYSFSVGFDTGYITTTVNGGERGLELLSAAGCLAWHDSDPSKPAVHLHATFTGEDFKAFGGHLVEVGNVVLTAEVFVTALSEEKIYRKLDTRVNVPLLDLPAYKGGGNIGWDTTNLNSTSTHYRSAPLTIKSIRRIVIDNQDCYLVTVAENIRYREGVSQTTYNSRELRILKNTYKNENDISKDENGADYDAFYYLVSFLNKPIDNGIPFRKFNFSGNRRDRIFRVSDTSDFKRDSIKDINVIIAEEKAKWVKAGFTKPEDLTLANKAIIDGKNNNSTTSPAPNQDLTRLQNRIDQLEAEKAGWVVERASLNRSIDTLRAEIATLKAANQQANIEVVPKG